MTHADLIRGLETKLAHMRANQRQLTELGDDLEAAGFIKLADDMHDAAFRCHWIAANIVRGLGEVRREATRLEDCNATR